VVTPSSVHFRSHWVSGPEAMPLRGRWGSVIFAMRWVASSLRNDRVQPLPNGC
jgi:hypothetical protein